MLVNTKIIKFHDFWISEPVEPRIYSLYYNKMLQKIQEKLWEHYREADISVLPSEHEEFGISVLEAMSAGCAVIVSKESGSSRHIQHGKNGLVFNGQKKEEYREEIIKIIKDSTLRSRIQFNAANTIEKYHSKEQFRKFILHEA